MLRTEIKAYTENEMRDIYGHEYELYSGKIYISKNSELGNVAAKIPNTENNGFHVIYFGKLDKDHIETAILANGWKLEDWL